MWREWSTHARGESEFLEEVLQRVKDSELWREQAESFLQPFKKLKSFKSLFNCPQSSDRHAEGAWVGDHLDLMSRVLFAVVGDDLHLGDIEEFRRLKGFAGELDEVEEILKEKVASLELFILAHDLGKPRTVYFQARAGSGGVSQCFHNSLDQAWNLKNEEQIKTTEDYNKEYKKFSSTMVGATPEEIQDAFFSAYQIVISYPGYAQQIARPELREVLTKESKKRRLTPEDTEDVFHLILLHEKILHDFSVGVNLSVYNHLVSYAIKYGRDPDDFLDLLLAAVFLEVCALPCRSAHGIFYDLSPFTNFLLSEHESVPGKRFDRIKLRQEKQLKIERQRLREAGLDGNDLLVLLDLKPGPEFGEMLKQIHEYAKGQGVLPELSEKVKKELFGRVEKFRNPPVVKL